MVCSRCEMAVAEIFKNSGYETVSVKLGEVITEKELTETEISGINNELKKIGFEILEDSSRKQIENIKNLIIQKIADLDIAEDFLLSEFIAENINKDYSAVSKLFSRNENTTLEQFFILQKVEKVKELLSYNEYTLTEISAKLGYKSVQHLSSQFKNITGFTPSKFKDLKVKNRISIDRV